ncbi:MAG: CAP domain-containing protein [Ilumatobacteraceae bacterium]
MKYPRIGAYGVTLALGLLGGGPLLRACAPPPPVSAPISVSQDCTALANNARTAAGLAPLTIDSKLTAAAEGHSTDQAKRKKMTHTGSNGSNAGQRITAAGYAWNTWGENVAAGQADCASVVSAWLASPGHRANILNPAMVHIGMGAVKGTNGVIYWTMDLAKPR